MQVVDNLDGFHIVVADSGIAGPSVCIVGGVHGNEICGLKSIEALEHKLMAGEKLLCGRLLMLKANLEAVRLKQRFVDFDLNRTFGEFGNLRAFGYESFLAKRIAPYLNNFDYVLDLHSTSASTQPFCAGKLTNDHLKIFRMTNIEFYTHGWEIHREYSMLIDEVDRQGGIGIIAECGKTGEPKTEETALNTTLRVLEELNMLPFNILYKFKPHKAQTVIRISEIVKSRTDHFVFVRNFNNFEYINSGEIIAYDNNNPIFCASDFLISMPARGKLMSGDEAFGIGIIEDKLITSGN